MNIFYRLKVIGSKRQMSRGVAQEFFSYNFFFYFFYYEKYILNNKKLSPIFNFAISPSCGSMWSGRKRRCTEMDGFNKPFFQDVNLRSAVALIPDVIAKWNFDTSLQLGWSLFLYHFSILIRKQKNYLCWAVAINLWKYIFLL